MRRSLLREWLPCGEDMWCFADVHVDEGFRQASLASWRGQSLSYTCDGRARVF
jgi:hypothetical protein